MTRSSFRPQARSHRRLEQLLLGSAVALVLTAPPMSLSGEGPLLSWHAAFAKDVSNGHGLGRGAGRGAHGPGQRGPDSQGKAYWYARGHGDHAGGVNEYHDVDEFLDNVRSGKAFGLEQRDERIAAAEERYQEALGNRGRQTGHAFGADEIGPAAHQFSPEETEALLERGWQGRTAPTTDGFRNQGERVRTMVELSKRLGYSARVGALQANFGTPFENGIADLQAQIEVANATGNQAEVERLKAELADAIKNAKPGQGPDELVGDRRSGRQR